MYATKNEYESGGTYWKPTAWYILFSVITFQIINAIITFSSGQRFISIFFISLIAVSFACAYGIVSVFDKISDCFPMNLPEENYLDNFSSKVMKERYKLMEQWVEILKSNFKLTRV